MQAIRRITTREHRDVPVCSASGQPLAGLAVMDLASRTGALTTATGANSLGIPTTNPCSFGAAGEDV